MKNFRFYNHSSEEMHEVSNDSIDLITSSISYNAGAKFGETWTDSASYCEFRARLTRIMRECSRVLKPGGRFIVEASDTAVSIEGEYLSIAAIHGKIAKELGLTLVERHFALIKSDLTSGEELPDHRWSSKYVSGSGNHSNAHQLLVFTKGEGARFDASAGRVIYYNYPDDEEGHPCPFSWEYIKYVLDNYFQPGMTVLDPCCGTARLGRETVRRGGTFVGYDINPDYSWVANNLFQAQSK
jgi:DNA modification methylase